MNDFKIPIGRELPAEGVAEGLARSAIDRDPVRVPGQDADDIDAGESNGFGYGDGEGSGYGDGDGFGSGKGDGDGFGDGTPSGTGYG